MIKLTQKEFDLLVQVNAHEATDAKPYKVVSNNNGAVEALVEQQLVQSRPKEGNVLMQELAVTTLGTQVVDNEVEHEIVMNHEVKQEETVMEENTDFAGGAVNQINGFVIEDNVPIPEIQTVRARHGTTMPLDRMQVGQSFLVPFKEGEDHQKGRKRVGATVSQTRKRLLGKDSPTQFITAITEHGYRVWRKA